MSEQAIEYTLPGILHYLQAEWRRFEREKNEWAIERAELKARIALLEGERRGIENVKMALTKRVKMLEYAIRQERKRHSNDTAVLAIATNTTDNTPKIDESKNDTIIVDHKMKEKSRQVLKSCLQEINYLTSFPSKLPLTNALTVKTTSAYKRAPTQQQQPSPSVPVMDSPRTNPRNKPTVKKTANNNNSSNNHSNNNAPSKKSTIPQDDPKVPVNVDEVAMINNIKEEKESHENSDTLSEQLQEKFHLSEDKVIKLMKHANKPKVQPENLSANHFDPSQIGDIDIQQQSQPKIWKPKVTIKGHLDSVRSVCFHSTEMLAASGSDDGTVKIWNLQRVTGNISKKGPPEEADPSITFRGHTKSVTTVAISASQNRVYSASLDSTIRVWSLPPSDHGPFSPVDPSLNLATYVGHTDAIWDFKLSPSNLLASVSADKTIKVWDTESSGSLLKSSFTFGGVISEESRRAMPAPTSLDFCKTDKNKIAISFANSKIRIYDIETGQIITTLNGSGDSYDNTVNTQINSIVCHPELPILVSGHEDRCIKFFDLNSGECIQTLSGHLDAVTTLDINASGSTLVSGGHDSSIRLWDLSSKTCIQEFSAHRRKGDEGVLDVKFHPSFPWMISGGADSIVKLYHFGQ